MKTLTEVVVLIERDAMTKSPTTVYEHEVLILQAIHGEDHVHVVEEYQVAVPEDFSVADEFERLRAKYDRRLRPGQPSVVVSSWGKNANALAAHLGMPKGSSTPKRMLESEQIVRDPRRVDAGKDGLIVDTSAKMSLPDASRGPGEGGKVEGDGSAPTTSGNDPTVGKTGKKLSPAKAAAAVEAANKSKVQAAGVKSTGKAKTAKAATAAKTPRTGKKAAKTASK